MEPDAPRKPGFPRKVLRSSEGKILIAGVVSALVYLGVVIGIRFWRPDIAEGLLSMIGANILGGRFTAMVTGFQRGLPWWAVVMMPMATETVMVLIFYPVFVLSYRGLIVIQPLEDTISRAREAARAHQKKIMKYGVPGLLLFVWFPFLMTGPLVGSVIGFFIGLRPRVTLPVGLAGTYLAVICWSLVLQPLQEFMENLGPYVPFGFMSMILLLAVSLYVRRAVSHHARTAAEHGKKGRGSDRGNSE